MARFASSLALSALLLTTTSAAPLAVRQDTGHTALISQPDGPTEYQISYGPRPYYIVQNMTEGPLKDKLLSCENGPFSVSGWSIGHRGGGTLQIPEESAQNEEAGARMGAGVLECDVSFTSDTQLVCRHSLCDLHTTTNILVTDLAAKCTQPFTPANETSPASALCCTSDITLDEYMTLCSKMDGSNSSATTPEDYQTGVPFFRTQLYDTCATPLSLESYIDLVNSFPGYRNFTPELKTPPAQVPMPFKGVYTQEDYANDMIEMFIKKGIAAERVWPQSFNPPDIFQWIKNFPEFGSQAVYLDEDGDTPETFTTAVARLGSLKEQGVNIISPPFNYLLTYGNDENNTIVPSSYATTAKEVGLDIIAWSFERSGPLSRVLADEDYYYDTINQAVHYDGQLYEILDILANQIGVVGMFSDWSATTGYFANCFGLTGPVGGSYYAKK